VTIEIGVFLPILPPPASGFGAPGISHRVFGKPPPGDRDTDSTAGVSTREGTIRWDAWQLTSFCGSAAGSAVEPAAFKPQYSEFGEFGAIRRVFLATGALNSSGLSSNSLCKGTRNYYSFEPEHPGFLFGVFLGPAT
jgi:hypothetical protein